MLPQQEVGTVLVAVVRPLEFLSVLNRGAMHIYDS